MNEPRLWPDGTPFPDKPALASEEAERRYRRALNWDPFPDIPEALLNSSDVYDYVRVTGMLCPFDDKCRKAASYEVSIGNRCIYWDNDGTLHNIHLTDGQSFTLQKNSIVFVNTKEEFRLPHYIAIRFNLRITNVHRGILLGTGPLVDPGFAGRLLIPLHNLTTNDYVFKKGDGFAWFEFTKVSPHDCWMASYRDKRVTMGLSGNYIEFMETKKWLEPEDYFEKALFDVQPKIIVSSIPESMLKAEKSAKSAEKHARTIRNWVAGLGIIATIAIFIALVGVILSSWQITTTIQESLSDTKASLAELTTQVDQALPRLNEGLGALSARTGANSGTAEQLRREIDQNTARTMALQEELAKSRATVEDLRALLNSMQRQINEH